MSYNGLALCTEKIVHVSMGAEKWLDIELWDSPQECFSVLKSRGYRIATTHVGMDAVSIYDMDWSCPTAIVVGNENRGISDEALKLSDLHCSIPMKGMVDSFNVSVAAGIVMHHAVCDRTSRLGCHGDLTVRRKTNITCRVLTAAQQKYHKHCCKSMPSGRQLCPCPCPSCDVEIKVLHKL
ncbi:tRNA guanosine-2'-O-methyltransferase [Melia azedarach]|uniref:tRNA guanosine-2'-O-methyltransferase n=1 Tax=Melia azedarach TaxID=155640 RepID=A0ACC1X7R8_MELAZ|nr:tRNA guanosine-2'-O-methyltransferase [Melia azedarach]